MKKTTCISGQAVGGRRCAGQSISFNVTAGGSGSFNYQWRKGGANLSGATNASYTMASVTAGDAGNYDVVVTGACGPATSTAATLAVNNTTGISSQPVGGSRCAGQSISFNVTASGTGPFKNQWAHVGTPLTQATNTPYSMSNITAGDAASYDVEVTDACGP